MKSILKDLIKEKIIHVDFKSFFLNVIDKSDLQAKYKAKLIQNTNNNRKLLKLI